MDHVLPHRPIRQWVLSFPYPLRFVLANHPQVMGKVLGIVNRTTSTHLINKAGFKVSQAHTGAVTLIQRFGSALNLDLHFPVLFIDGVFSLRGNGQLRFHRVNAPTSKELNSLVATITYRIAMRPRRYNSRPALSEPRLELTDQGVVRYALKSAYRDGTTLSQDERWILHKDEAGRAMAACGGLIVPYQMSHG